MKYARIIAEFCGRAWALPEDTLIAMVDLLTLQAAGEKWPIEEIRQRIDTANAQSGYQTLPHCEATYFATDETQIPLVAASGKRNAAAAGSVAVIPVMGIISQRANLLTQISGAGGTSIDKLTLQFRQALGDSNCKAIVFDCDSPGGSVNGVPELAAEIYNARKQKPIVAVANSMCGSAAYWLMSATSEIVTTSTGLVGSIGVYATVQDNTEAMKNEGVKVTLIKAGKYKAEGDPSQPLSEEAQAFMQSQVDSVYSMFVKAVAQNRATSQDSVRNGYGQGRALLGNDAVKADLADRVGTLEGVLAKFGVKSSAQYTAIASEAVPTAAAGKPALNASAEDEDDDNFCGCSASNGEPCSACQACENADAPDPDSDGCACACDACKACDAKAAAATARAAAVKMALRRRELAIAAAAI